MHNRALCVSCGACIEACPEHMAKAGCISADRCAACARACLHGAKKCAGEIKRAESVMETVMRDLAYYKRSGGGMTLSGGECLLQKEFCMALLWKAHEEDVHTAVDTCLEAEEDTVLESAAYTDLYLADVKHMDTEKHRRGTGVGNERILRNLSRLMERNKKIWVRVPLIPGFNDEEENFVCMGEFLKGAKSVERIELLPGHGMSQEKYEMLDRRFVPVVTPERKKLDSFAKILEKTGQTVRIRSL